MTHRKHSLTWHVELMIISLISITTHRFVIVAQKNVMRKNWCNAVYVTKRISTRLMIASAKLKDGLTHVCKHYNLLENLKISILLESLLIIKLLLRKVLILFMFIQRAQMYLQISTNSYKKFLLKARLTLFVLKMSLLYTLIKIIRSSKQFLIFLLLQTNLKFNHQNKFPQKLDNSWKMEKWLKIDNG